MLIGYFNQKLLCRPAVCTCPRSGGKYHRHVQIAQRRTSFTMSYRLNRRSFLALSGGALGAAFLAACGGGDDESASTGGATALDPNRNVTLRLGYFPNVTHAQPNVGLENGTYARVLGSNVKLETKTFNAGPSVIEAI